MTLRSTPKQYGMIAVLLHWTIAGFILAALISGFAVDAIGKSAQEILIVHIFAGIMAALLTLLRIIWWLVIDTRPLALSGHSKWLVNIIHFLFYVIPLGMALSGLAMMFFSGAADQLFSSPSGPLPDFDLFRPKNPHILGSRVLLGLLALHVCAALYHRFAQKTPMRILYRPKANN